MRHYLSLFIFLILFLSSNVNAQTSDTSNTNILSNKVCIDVSNTIAKDIGSVEQGAVSKYTRFPWKNLNWLQQQLGSGEVHPLNETISVWPQFILYISGGISNSIGSYPGMNTGPSREATIKALGKPTKEIIGEGNEFQWRCDNGSNSIKVQTDKDGKIMNVDAHDCCKEKFIRFKANRTSLIFQQLLTEMKMIDSNKYKFVSTPTQK